MAEINNGAILVLLLPNVIFMASIMYTAEHVITLQHIFSLVFRFALMIPSIHLDYYGLGYARV